jgi:amino acid transporter
MFPKSGAEYVYVLKAYHNKQFTFIIGWLIVLTDVVSAAAVSIGFAGYFKSLIVN